MKNNNNAYLVHKIYQRQKEDNLDNIYWEKQLTKNVTKIINLVLDLTNLIKCLLYSWHLTMTWINKYE